MSLIIDLTVAICAYNAEKYIEKTIKSLKEQTLNNFYWLFIDDASTDKTLIKVKECIAKFNIQNYRVLGSECNKGIAYQRKRALDEVKTKYMLFFDADDIAEKNMIEKFYNALNQDSHLIAVGGYESLIDENDQVLPGGIRVGFTNKKTALERAKYGKLFFLPMRSMFLVESAKKAGGIVIDGFPEGKPRYADYCEDCDLWTRMSDEYIEGNYLLVIPESLVRYRKHSSSISADSINMLIKMRYIKNNVKRRRNGLEDISFINFYSSLSEQDLITFRKEAHTSSLVRKAGFELQQKKVGKAVIYGFRAILENPKYVYQKVKPFLKR